MGAGAGLEKAERGAKLLGASEGLREVLSFHLSAFDRMVYDRSIASARSQLGEETFEAARQEGRVMSMDEAIDYALQES